MSKKHLTISKDFEDFASKCQEDYRETFLLDCLVIYNKKILKKCFIVTCNGILDVDNEILTV